MSNERETILDLVKSADVRADIYRQARVVLPTCGARCATTQSLLLIKAGVLNGVRIGTSPLLETLKDRGWAPKWDVSMLQPGDMCFSRDLTGKKGWPDHVYLFLRWLNKPNLVAEIFDNNSKALIPRNIGKAVWYKGRRLSTTPFGFALCPPS
jgi:hypothetical protein